MRESSYFCLEFYCINFL